MDDRRFRAILRSALALSLVTPAVVVACGGERLDPFYQAPDQAPDAAVTPSPTATGPLSDAAAIEPADAAADGPALLCGDAGEDFVTGTPNPCAWTVRMPCGVVAVDPATFTTFDADVCAVCTPDGGATPYGLQAQCFFSPGTWPGILNCSYGGCPGRRPEGLRPVALAVGTVVGAWLAEAARMEAASVHAFAALRAELLAYDAPADLVERAERAQVDEVRHARMMSTLARRLGADEGAWSDEPEVTRPPARELEAIALENATEGCVNETYAALLALWQAERARDEGVRAAMASIAEDETRHAALAWSVASWARARLDRDTGDRIDAARAAAFEMLRTQPPPHPALVAEGLVPSADEARRLVDALAVSLAAA